MGSPGASFRIAASSVVESELSSSPSFSLSQSQIPRDFRLCVCVCVCVCFKKKGFEMKVKSATFQKGACEATMADSATSSVLSVLVHCSLHKKKNKFFLKKQTNC